MANIEKYIDKITVPSGSDTVTNHLVDTVSGYLKTIPYLTCTDTASTVAKTTTLISGVFTEDNLVDGAQVMVKFTNFNTATAPTLSVNGTTAKSIKRYGTQSPSTSAATSWNNGSVVSFVYDGTYWQQVGFLNSTYSEISYDSITDGSGSATGLISGRRAKTAVETFAPVKSVNGGTGDVTITVPTKTSDLTNDSGFITGSDVPSNETDPTVPSWAKASTKPSYTASEVGALPDTTVIPSATSDLTNDSGFITASDVPSAGTTATAVSTTASGGSATTWSKSDHVHSLSSSTVTSALGYTPYNSTNPDGYTTNTGTVTSVAISGSSPISASGTVTSTGTLSVSHETSGVTAQSTQALYPFKVNATGHITSVGSAVTIPSAGSTASSVGTSSSGGSASTWSKSDHVHDISGTTITTALGYTPYNSTNPNGYITLSDVPEEVVNTEFIPSDTPITSWVSGNWQISVTGNIGTGAQIEFEKITTGNHVEYPGHRFPISIPAVGAGVGKMFAVGMFGYTAMGAQLKDSTDTNLIALYSASPPTEASISSSVMSSATGITLLITGDTNNTVTVGTTCTFNNIRIYNSSTQEVLWTLLYEDAVEFTDGSSSVPFTDLKQALTDGKVLQLYDDNGVCYPYISETSSTITFGKISNSSIEKYIVDNTDTVTITTDVLKATPSIYNITLPTASWTTVSTGTFTQTVTVTGISSSDYPFVQPDITTTAQKTAWSYVVKGEAVTNGIEFTALSTQPSVDLSAVVMVF